MTRRTRIAVVTAAACAGPLLGLAPAMAAGGPTPSRGTMQLQCDDAGTVVIVTPPASAHDNWSAAQIVAGGHLVPVSFTYRAYDETAGILLGEDTVSRPHAHGQQETTTCQADHRATLGQLVPAGAPLPDGAAETDTVLLSFIATAVVRP